MGSEVKILKLTTGQEIIAKVYFEAETAFVIESPLVLQAMRQGESMSIGLMPFTWGGRTNEQIQIGKEHIICSLYADEDLANQYLAGLAGLTIPTPSARKLTLVE